MGWFWADSAVNAPAANLRAISQHGYGNEGSSIPPAGCPMHKQTADALMPSSKCQKPAAPAASSCPVPHDQRTTASEEKPKSMLSQLNPLNYMFPDLSQAPAPNQTYKLPTSREESSIPKAEGEEKWEYPSPQQMYNALLRKGYDDTDITAVEDMVTVHNFLNEGAWREVVGWEERFAGGLLKGFQICKRGEENAPEQLKSLGEGTENEPTLIRFQGRPKDLTPKAAFWQLLAKAQPDWFGVDPPFDRHDWYVARRVNGQMKEIRYVIDYYSGPPEPTGEPVFFLDVRPAMTPTGAAERLIRWSTDVWWRASGGAVREAEQSQKKSS